MERTRLQIGSPLVVALTLGLSLGCAQDVGTIDRTQPGLIQKSVFEGDWFLRRTVIDVPYDVGYTFIGETEDAIRIRWDLQRDQLSAYRVNPLVDNTPDEAPVAVFAIDDHVDVIREYNPSTGEQTNVVREDSSDRVWYERKFVRVDWSKNLVTGFGFYADQLEQEPVGYFAEDVDDPDRVLLGVKAEDGTWTNHQDPLRLRELDDAQYIDVVSKIFVTPEQIPFEDYDGSLVYEPACWYYLNYDCAPAVISVRNAFLRVDAAVGDYEPLDYPDNYVLRDEDGTPVRTQWNATGDRERTSTDPGSSEGEAPVGDGPYDAGDTSVVRLPMFDKFGFFRTERYGYDEEYGEVEGRRTYLINRWNIWERTHDADGALLPFAERGYRPIVYYLSPGFPEELKAAAHAMVDQWDAALRETADALTGGTAPRLYELRDNTYQVDAESGAVTARGEAIGDLRYSHVYWVHQPTRAGLLGYGPSASDPLTGEVFAADAYIYGAVLRQYAADGRDVIDLINGRLSPEDFSAGENVAEYLHQLRGSESSRARPSAREVADFANSHRAAAPPARSNRAPMDHRLRPPSPSAIRPGLEKLRRPAGWSQASLAQVRGSSTEDLLMSDPMLRAMKGHGLVSPDPSGGIPAGLRNRLSPVSWSSAAHHRATLEHFRSFAKRNMMMASFFDDAIAGLALEHVDTPRDELLDLLVAEIFASTAEHEVGHTLGLRHNFEASTDALNYHPEYWRLRGDNPVPMADMTEAERSGRLREHQYSSIMDYAGRFNADIAGLGYYDRAAIKFGYGQLIEAFETDPNDPLLELVAWDDGTYEKPFDLDTVLRELRHYTKIPSIFGGVANLERRKNVPYTEETAALMGQPGTSYAGQVSGDLPWSHTEVPYRFCSDEYVMGTGTCLAYDLGADSYEVATDAMDRYWNYYWFNNFQRDRVFFDQWDYMDSMWWRYFSVVQNTYQHWVFNQWFQGDTWDYLAADASYWGVEDEPWTQAVDGGLVSTAAVMEIMRFLQRVIAIPEPGAYMYDFDEEYYWAIDTEELPVCESEWSFYSTEWCADVNLGLGDARHLFSVYDYESGYYFYERLKWVGAYYDKILALEAMTSPDTYFLGVESSESADEWAVSMYLSFPKEIQKLMSGVASDRFDLFAGVIEEGGFTYVPPDPFATGAAATVFETSGSVDPSSSFTIQLYALWFGMSWLNANYDNSFNDGAKIWMEGSGEAIEPVDPGRVVRFENPLNNRTYAAVTPEDPEVLGVGQQMLEQANQWKVAYEAAVADGTDEANVEYYEWKLRTITENIEVVRGLYDLYGYVYF